MDANAQAELDGIKNELNAIIRELESISGGVRRDFVGIGNEQCAICIDRVIGQYRDVESKLGHLDTSKVMEGFAPAHGGG